MKNVAYNLNREKNKDNRKLWMNIFDWKSTSIKHRSIN